MVHKPENMLHNLNLHHLLLLSFSLLSFFSCKTDDEDPPAFPNLITNGDFENPLNFNTTGWTATGEYTNYVRVPAVCPDGGQSMLTLNRGNGTSAVQSLYYNAIIPEQGPHGYRLSVDYRYDGDSASLSVGIVRRSRNGTVYNLGIFDLNSPSGTCLEFSSVFTQSWLDGDTAQVQMTGNNVRIDNLELRRNQ